MDDVESVLLSCVEERSLAIDIFIFKVETFIKQQFQTLFLALPADIEEHGLLIAVLEVRIGAVHDQ